MTKYAVTGATGHLGRLALGYLKDKGLAADTVAVVRDSAKATDLTPAGFDVRVADYTDKSSLVEAFNGVDRVLFISSVPGGDVSRQAQHTNVVDAAKEAGVNFIAYTSLANAQQSTSVLAPDHQATEAYLKDSGLAYAFLRNNWYLENDASVFETALTHGVFSYSAGEGKAGWALRREYAEAAVNVLTKATQGVIELSGNLITYADLATSLQAASGKDFQVVALSHEAYADSLTQAGLPEEVVGMIVGIQRDIEAGALDYRSNEFEAILGHPLTPTVDALKELLNL